MWPAISGTPQTKLFAQSFCPSKTIQASFLITQPVLCRICKWTCLRLRKDEVQTYHRQLVLWSFSFVWKWHLFSMSCSNLKLSVFIRHIFRCNFWKFHQLGYKFLDSTLPSFLSNIGLWQNFNWSLIALEVIAPQFQETNTHSLMFQM